MNVRCFRLFVFLLMMLPFPPPMAVAQNAALVQAERSFYRGHYQEALAAYQEVQGADRVAALVGASRTWAMLGDYETAENHCRQALKAFPNNGRIATELAELWVMQGKSRQALDILKTTVESPNPSIRSFVQYGKLLKMHGQREEAIFYFEKAIDQYNEGLVFESEALAMVAVAAWQLEAFQDANRLFREAIRVQPRNLEAQVLWGDLFLAKYNENEAQTSYRLILEKNRRYVPALVGMGKILPGAAAKNALDAALAINPASLPALETLATIEIEDERYDKAESHLQKMLAINPESLAAQTLLAAIAQLKDDFSTYETLRQSVAQLRPDDGTFYEKIAEILGRKYRFKEAVELAQTAIETDPNLWNAYTILGTNLLRLGKETEGRRYLEKSFEKDPFNVLTKNMLAVLDVLDGFETLQTEHFIVRMHQSDAAVLWPHLQPFLEEMWNTLTAKYQFTPQSPILLEIFHNNEDFAARTIGLPNIGPLIGVCFGNVITMTSPITLQPAGFANWKEIIWHEFVHVITLQMTHNRIPRWLSEGISVFEEHQGRPEWGRKQNLDLVRAVQEDHFLPLAQLNEGFSKATSAEALNFAYYQSSLLVQYMVERYGFQRLLTLLEEYQTYQPMNTIIQTVFGQTLGEFEAGFHTWTEKKAQQINIYVHQEDPNDQREGHGHGVQRNALTSADPRLNPDRLMETMRARIQEQPRDFMAHFQLGMLLYRSGKDNEAIPPLKTAQKLLPSYGGTPNPYQILAEIYQKQGKEKERIAELEKWVAVQQHAFRAAYQLAQAKIKRNNPKKALYYLQRTLDVNPYHVETHKDLATISLKQGNYPQAIRQYKILVALENTDPAKAKTDLADAYLRGGKKKEAKQTALDALEIAPTYERAQTILLDSLEP